jgi:ABC-type bacteriocin/lantibiotic exporter with double-glycine peptidase domain
MSPMLSIQGVVAGYLPQVDILNGVDVTVAKGEIVTVVGPNGAGKSTLLKAIIGLLAPKRGAIVIDGQDITGQTASAIVRRGIGYVPQRENVLRDDGRRGEPRDRPDDTARLAARRAARGDVRALPAPAGATAPGGRQPVGRRAADGWRWRAR